MTPETRRIASQIGRSHKGVAWHGPSVVEALSEVDAAMAVARLHPDLHTIWDWPPPSGAEWPQASAEMARINSELVEAVRNFPAERLDEKVSGQPFDFYFLLHGIAQHNTYHAGQISLLKKLSQKS